MRRKIRSIHLRSERGSYTIEASLVFPLILVCTITLLFAGMYAYQHVFVAERAGTAAERLAATWDNSRKNIASGGYTPGESDGLYWRLSSDHVLDLFGMLFQHGQTTIALASAQPANLVERKLVRAAQLLPHGVEGTASYRNLLVDRQIEVDLEKSFMAPPMFQKWLSRDLTSGKAVTHVVDAVELIRLTDITRTYFSAIKGRISPEKAKEALVEPVHQDLSGPSISIQSERQASTYLRSLVGGSEVVLTTPSGKSRTIDALDSRGIAHQAFYSMTESQLRAEQLPKDVELLDQGTTVRGVVWHFFKKDASGKGMPSDAFRKELERKGIVVVIHN
ncbi:TadE/TadG family type IV pilus assembly protein [Paenibacillus ferrarius]|uniref:TadE/TadG family type IV pilus assembly protein n=1 Tax=Paenibacillus ferrarius TaxID=1469647 RepID=UPI003D2709BE